MSWRAFFGGAARVLDLFGTMSQPVDLPETDEEAFAQDAQALMSDLSAIRSAQLEHELTPEQWAAVNGERNRPLVRPKLLPKRRAK